MAMERGHGYGHKRNSWWFLLKDSVIFVLIMCMLQVLHTHLLPKVIIVKATTTASTNIISNTANDSQLISRNAAANVTDTFIIKTKENELNTKIYASDMHLNAYKQELNQHEKTKKNVVDTISTTHLNNTSSRNNSKLISNSINLFANNWNLKGDFPNNTYNNNDNNRNSSEKVNKSLKDSRSEYDLKSNYNKKILEAKENFIRENVVLPSEDPEREAQLLYEQSLKDYHEDSSHFELLSNISVAEKKSDNQTSHNNINSNKTVDQHSLQSVCHLWTVKHCQCTGTLQRLVLNCRGIGILAVPVELPGTVVQLDLGNNNISQLPANTFFMVTNLEELTLSGNKLINIDPHAFYGLSKLKRLNLQNCGLTTLPDYVFQGLPHLMSLQLNANAFVSLGSKSLHIENLRTLRLEGNSLTHIPTDAFAGLKALEALNLGSNSLTIINDADFPKLPNLVVLLLKRNQIMKITAGAFSQLAALKVLELDDNLINTLPKGLNKLTQLQEFSIANNRLRWINDTDLPKNVHTLDFRANPLSFIAPSSLQGMLRLRKLILSDVRTLKVLPEFEGCYSLEILKLDRAGIMDVPASLCRQVPRLKSLELKKNSLVRIPNLGHCRELRLLDLSNNYIETLHGRPFVGLKQLHDLVLSYNHIKSIPQDAFFGIPRLQLLDLEGNEIHYIHKDAFTHFTSLEDLNLGNNIFPELPSSGLHKLLHLKTFNNPKLRDFPTPDTFPRIQTLILSYAYHCCAFLPLVAMSAHNKKTQLVQETVLFPTDPEFDINLWNSSSLDVWPYLHNFSKKFNHNMQDVWNNLGQDFNYPMGLPPNYVEEYPEEDNLGTTTLATAISGTFAHLGTGLFGLPAEDVAPGSVQCLPMPGPFLPCADLFDWWTLRCGVWVVFLLALLGNGTVVVVLIFSRSKMDVPRFLVSNLAAADFFMGVYLGILAMVDASTLGEFRMFAIPWQMSVVCQLAGFLAVLSSELSVYTLAVITLERNYAITHAIHLNKRLSLRKAGYIMLIGWIFAIVMAILPLVGVSDYRKFAVCLPFETTTSVASLTYVVALMFINGCAFLTLMGCYLKMYWAIRGSQAWNSNDSRIAKRMALLVFTDFLCWSPIAFFSLTAIFGLQLISLEQAKIFTVFILPLNSCCNPFMYAIMTKQFKKDCVNLCKSLEETRVARTATGNARRGGERALKNAPPLMPAPHPPGCRCLRMMPSEMPNWHKMQEKTSQGLWARSWLNFNKICLRRRHNRQRRKHNAHNTDPYQYQFAEIKKQKKQTRASSISSENFCSSRSSSWRNGPPSVDAPAFHSAHHTCSIPMKHMGDPNRRRHSAWLITRKTSQDSNLSSSRNDSSASATTASTSTFRLSRSSAGSSTPLPPANAHGNKQLLQFSTLPKPRLVRQEAVQEEEDSSPPRLGVRFLPTIPSAADSSIIMDDADSLLSAGSIMGLQMANTPSNFFALMQPNSSNNNNNRTSLATVNATPNSSPQKSEMNKHPP